MAQFYFQPLAEDEGNAPSNITFTVMAPDGATPGTNAIQQFDGDLAWILDLDNATNWLLRIDSIDGVAIPDSADTEIYIEMSPQGASSDFGVAARITETSPGDFDAYGLLASRGTDDWSLRRFNDSSIRRTFGTGLGGDSFPGTEQFWRKRFRVNGDPDPTVSGSLWDPTDPEPTDWEVQAQDTDGNQITGTGFSAIARRITNSNFAETRIRGIGIGTDGDPAPTGPVNTNLQTTNITSSSVRAEWSPI